MIEALEEFIKRFRPVELIIVCSKDQIEQVRNKVDVYTYSFASDKVQKTDDMTLDYAGVTVRLKEQK